MTTVLIFVASALVLASGWFLGRVSGAQMSAAAGGAGDDALLEQSPVGTVLLDSTLRVTRVNDAFCDLFGLSGSEVVGRGFAEVVQRELGDSVVEPEVVESALMAAYNSSSQVSPFQFYLRAQDDEDGRLVEHTSRLLDRQPLEGTRVAYFVDVTPGKVRAATPPRSPEIHADELDRVLIDLACKRGSNTDEASALREVAEVASKSWKPDRWELWRLGEDRTEWELDRLSYTPPRRDRVSTPSISIRQTGPYLRALDQARVMVTSDLENDPDAHSLLGHGQIKPDAASRLDVPIRLRGKVVAVLVVIHHTPRIWTLSERQFAASIGDHMSLCLALGGAAQASSDVEIPGAPPLPPEAASTVDGFLHLDERLRFTFLNPAVLRWLDERGLDGTTLVGRTLEDSMKGLRDKGIIAEVRKSVRGGGPARLRRQLEPDGPWFDVFVNPSATGVSVTIQNRARRKEREVDQSLRESETRFRSVVESLGEGLLITDLDDYIVYVNSRISDLTGHRPEDLDGRQAQDLLFDTANWEDRDSRLAARRERKRTRYDAPLLDRNGKILRVEVISTPLRDADGAVTGVVDAITAMGDRGSGSEQVGEAGGAP